MDAPRGGWAGRRFRALVLAALATLPALGAESIPRPVTPAAAATPDPAADVTAFRARWQAFVAAADAGPLQPGCQGGLLKARGTRRGAVLVIHGFGACPQQFAALAPVLAESGFDVLLARLPGHGRPARADGSADSREDLREVPAAGAGAQRYDEFGRAVLTELASSPGERAVVGFSLGAAVALRAVADAPGRATRVVLLAPLVAIRGGAPVEWLAAGFGRMPGLARLDVKHFGPRAECAGWARNGRAGFCGYELRHAAGLVDLLRANRRTLASADVAGLPPLQLVTAGRDRYVSNAATARFVVDLEARGGTLELAELPDAPHELLTPYENPGRPMTWTPALATLVLRGIGGPNQGAGSNARAGC